MLVLVAGLLGFGGPRALEPATIRAGSGRVTRRRRRVEAFLAESRLRDDATTMVLDSLRAIGIVRRRVDRPVVGRKAYVRWWERVRALIVLAAIVVGLGVALAVIVGVTVLGAGFILERAIS